MHNNYIYNLYKILSLDNLFSSYDNYFGNFAIFILYIAIKGKNGSYIWMQQNDICKFYQILFQKLILPNDKNFENVTIFTIQEGFWGLWPLSFLLLQRAGCHSQPLWAHQLSNLLHLSKLL